MKQMCCWTLYSMNRPLKYGVPVQTLGLGLVCGLQQWDQVSRGLQNRRLKNAKVLLGSTMRRSLFGSLWGSKILPFQTFLTNSYMLRLNKANSLDLGSCYTPHLQML